MDSISVFSVAFGVYKDFYIQHSSLFRQDSLLSYSSWRFLVINQLKAMYCIIAKLFDAFSFLEQIVAYFVGLIPSGFYLVLGDKNLDGFIQQTLESIGIVLGMVLIITMKEYVIKLLNLSWRQLLTRAVHRLYYTDISYYQLNVLDRFIDNP